MILWGLFILFPVMLFAQSDSERIFGQVVNQQNQPIPTVTIQLENGAITVSNAKGTFSFSQVLHFPVQLQLSAAGYQEQYIQLDSIDWNTKNGFLLHLEEGAQLDEVVVLGRKKTSYRTNNAELGGKLTGKLKDLPQSVSLITRGLIEDKQAFTITEMAHDMAGVNLASSYDDFTIRGFKSGYETGYRLVNGLRSGYGYGTSYFRVPLTVNLESIEVLKGPGASLFGDITPGGTINMVTKKPLDDFKGRVAFSSGSFQTLRTTVDVGGPLNEDKTILYRFNFGYENSQTFRDVNQRKTLIFAPSFTFKPAEGTQVNVDFIMDNFDGYLDRGMGISRNDFYALPRSFTLSQPSDFFKVQDYSLSVNLEQKLAEGLMLHANYMKFIYQEQLNEHRTLNSFANAPTNTIMNMRFLARDVKEYTDNAVTYLTYNLEGSKIRHHFVFGVDYSSYMGDSKNQQWEARSALVNGTAVPLTFDLEHPTYSLHNVGNYIRLPQASFPFLSPYHAVGVYAQDQMNIGDRLNLVLGLRQEFYNSKTTAPNEIVTAKQQAILPRLGLMYHLTNQINYFASYSQGYVPLAANFVAKPELYGSDKPFKSEQSFQIESGFKTEFFKKKLQVDLSFFHIQRDNMLITTGALTDAGNPIYRQSGSVTSQGVELEIHGNITPDLQIMANYSYDKTKVKSSSIASEVGLPLGNAPKNMAGAWLKYVIPASTLKGLGFGAGFNYVDERRMDNAIGTDSAGNKLWGYWPSYTTVNAATYYHIGNFDMALNVNNVFDRYYFIGGFDYTRAFPGAPRTIMGSIGYSF